MNEHAVSPLKKAPAVEDIPALLMQTRAARDVTLADVSEQTGLTVSTLSRIENGIYKPRADTFVKLLQWLELSPGDMQNTHQPDTMTAIADVLGRDPHLSETARKQLLRAWRPMYDLYRQHEAEQAE